MPLTSLIEGGAQERGRRAGTENVAAAAGMAAALEESCSHMAENAAKVSALRDQLIAGLSRIPHAALNGDPVNRLPGNVNFCFEGIEGESLLLLLDDRGICASSGSACTSGSLDPSHVLLATELIKGKPLSETLKLTNQAVTEALGISLPPSTVMVTLEPPLITRPITAISLDNVNRIDNALSFSNHQNTLQVVLSGFVNIHKKSLLALVCLCVG